MNYDFLPIQTDKLSIKKITELLQITFPHAKKYTESFVDWQYDQNPIGKMVGYNAFLDNELAAHYALMPIKAKVFGKEELGLLSLNTATHPKHRGKKLFTRLATDSYALAREQGYGFVIGVANAQSTHGFLRKLDFQLVGPLEAKLGLGPLKKKKKKIEVDYEKCWDQETLSWRLANPSWNYRVHNGRISSATDKKGIKAILMDMDTNEVGEKKSIGYRPMNLWLGVDDTIDWGKSFYFDIPEKFKPSPLNLIFKDLTGKGRLFNFSSVRFRALDFDAY